MTKFIHPVSMCCDSEIAKCNEIYPAYPDCEKTVCTQCGQHCEIVEGDGETIEFDNELNKADDYNKATKEN